MSDPDFNYLVVSDLHLSAGVDPRTNQLSVNDDFLSDAAFAEFLRFHNLSAKRRSAEGDSAPWKLIINGDLFCFLSVTSYPARDANALCTSVNKLLAQPAQPFFPLAEPTLRRQQAQDWLQQAAAACNEAESKSHLRIGRLAAQLLEAGNTLPVDKLWEYMRLAIETLILAQKKGKAALPRKHRTYGLGTSWPETVWKLDRIAESHPIFFQALAWFMDQGHSVVVIKGNHDVEFFWPEVQQRMQDLLCDAHAQLSLPNSQWWTNEPLIPILRTATQFKKSLEEQFKIEPWMHYVPDLMYVEHGNQYEILNGIDDFLAPILFDSPQLIRLPPGAFFGRYVQNKVEQVVPFIDNLRPISRALGWGFKNRFFRYLWAITRNFLSLIRVFFSTIWRSWFIDRLNLFQFSRRRRYGVLSQKQEELLEIDIEKSRITGRAL